MYGKATPPNLTLPLVYLNEEEVRQLCPSSSALLGPLEDSFRLKASGEIEMPPKPEVAPKADSTVRAMLACNLASGASALKAISGFAENYSHGVSNINGLTILFERDYGLPVLVAPCAYLTAQRTGAAAALSAKHIVHEPCTQLGLIACGAVARATFESMMRVFDLERVCIFDIRKPAAEKFASEISKFVEPVICETANAVAQQSQVTVSSGPIYKVPEPTIDLTDLPPGSLFCALDFDSYLMPTALRGADSVVTDDVAQLEYYRKNGYFQTTPETLVEFCDVLGGKSALSTGDGKRNLCINLGIAMSDLVAAEYVLEQARKQGVGAQLAR